MCGGNFPAPKPSALAGSLAAIAALEAAFVGQATTAATNAHKFGQGIPAAPNATKFGTTSPAESHPGSESAADVGLSETGRRVAVPPPSAAFCACGHGADGLGCTFGQAASACGLTEAAPAAQGCCGGAGGDDCLCAEAARSGIPLTACLLAAPAPMPSTMTSMVPSGAAPLHRVASIPADADAFVASDDFDALWGAAPGAPAAFALGAPLNAAGLFAAFGAHAAQNAAQGAAYSALAARLPRMPTTVAPGASAPLCRSAPPLESLTQSMTQSMTQSLTQSLTPAGPPLSKYAMYAQALAASAGGADAALGAAAAEALAMSLPRVKKGRPAGSGAKAKAARAAAAAAAGDDSDEGGSLASGDEGGDGAGGTFSERVRKRRRESARRSRVRKNVYIRGIEAENEGLKAEVVALRRDVAALRAALGGLPAGMAF